MGSLLLTMWERKTRETQASILSFKKIRTDKYRDDERGGHEVKGWKLMRSLSCHITDPENVRSSGPVG